MDNRISEIIGQIRALEDELIDELKHKEKEFFYKIENEKVRFEENVIKEGKLKIISSIRYLSTFPLLAVFTIPFIWAMMLPAFMVDVFATVYQMICFPIYKIPKVKRKDYVIIDRYNLFYLGKVEKVNCLYCEYFNGVIAYVREMAARTEQYWCPIKHSQPLKDKHSRYDMFFDYGDYTRYREELERKRSSFSDVENTKEA